MPDHRDRTAPRVRWGLMDAALSALAPRTAAKRYAARVAISNLRRDYDAAGRGRGTSGWSSRGTAADAEIAADGPLLRHRMRDLVRNNPMPISTARKGFSPRPAPASRSTGSR